jgi:hypothetical protein
VSCCAIVIRSAGRAAWGALAVAALVCEALQHNTYATRHVHLATGCHPCPCRRYWAARSCWHPAQLQPPSPGAPVSVCAARAANCAAAWAAARHGPSVRAAPTHARRQLCRARHKRERAVLAGCAVGGDASAVAVPLLEALAGPAGVVAACSALVANTLTGGVAVVLRGAAHMRTACSRLWGRRACVVGACTRWQPHWLLPCAARSVRRCLPADWLCGPSVPRGVRA